LRHPPSILEAAMKSRRHSTDTAARFSALSVVAVIVNYPWELAQSGLFAETVERGMPWWHCFVASLGDGNLVCVIYACGWAVFRRADWFERSRSAQYAFMLTIGGLIGVVVEWVAVHLAHRWTYAATMPLIPGLSIGVVPVFQMMVLPSVIFRLVGAWTHRDRK
jgi:hypothetical protein